MGSLNLQLNAAPAILRDMTVNLVNEATSEKRTVSPFLDGSVQFANIDPGRWQVQALHPNLLTEVVNRPVRVFPDRPTFQRIVIPENIFSNAAIADTPDADLAPSQRRLDQAEADSRDQANKVPGQPIFADDWNALATTLADTAKATRELSGLISPIGHDHPEIVAKITETQDNLQRFYDLFARSLAELQRQIEQLALRRKLDDVAGKLPNLPPASRERMTGAIDRLTEGYQDAPAVYALKRRRAGEAIQEEIGTALVDATPDIVNDANVRDLQDVAGSIVTSGATTDYGEEIKRRQRTENTSSGGMLLTALKGAGVN